MWWSRALLLTVLLALGPAGCGFRPMYAKPTGAASGVDVDLARIRIGPLKDRNGQILRNALIQRLTPRGEAADYLYTLDVKLSETVGSLGYRKDTFATVANMSVSAAVRLTKDGANILGDTVATTVYFDYLGPRYASLSMERDAEERALNQLAEEIRNRVAVAIERYNANPNDEKYRRRAIFGEEPDRTSR
jgi:LPS-assembly lipoprotein